MLETERTDPVRAWRTPTAQREALDLSIPANGRPLSDVVDHLGLVGEATPNTASPRFFNQLFGGRIEAATMADMLAGLLNNSMYTYKVAGPQVLIERCVLDHMLGFAGYTDGEGTFTPGGSLSNLLAMVIGRGEVFPDARATGIGERRATVYTSAEGHYSIRKNAGLIGIGRDRVRAVASDDQGRMLPDALRAAIEKDIAEGFSPFFLNLTAGTTVLGAFDPIETLTAVARDYGLWVHVDGALGGSMLVSPKHRRLLDGISRADSLTWDAHKTMGVPLTSSVCLIRQRGLLAKNLSESASYLFQNDEPNLDPGHTSLQCGRRNDALKLWAAWQNLGDVGYAARIDKMFELARHAAKRVEQIPEFTLVRTPESINVCFRVEDAPADAVCHALAVQRRALVGHALVDGEPVVRLVCVNPDIGTSDIDRFMEDVRHTAGQLRGRIEQPRKDGTHDG